MDWLRDLKLAARLGPVAWLDFVRAAWELAIANRRLGSHPPADLLASVGATANSSLPCSDRDRRLVERVAFAVPRMGARVPWRSDCLVQALAAKQWLEGEGIATSLCIGVQDKASPEFEAHAWLKVGDLVVTGGDVASHRALTPVGKPGN